MNEHKQNKILLEVDFGDLGGKKSWYSYDEAISWINELQSNWNWLSDNANQNNFSIIWDSISQKFSEILNLLHHANAFKNQTQFEQENNHKIAARNILESFIKLNPWLLPNSIELNYIKEIKASGKIEEACITVAHLLKLSLQNMPVRFVVLALIRWEMFEKGTKDRVKFENANLKRLAADLESTLTKYQDSEHTQTTKFNELFEDFNQQKISQNEKFDEEQEREKTALDTQLEQANLELENIKETYDKHMALKAPVEYWESKRIKHRNWVFGTASALVIGMIISGCLLNFQLQTISNSIEKPNLQISINDDKNNSIKNEATTSLNSLNTQSNIEIPKEIKSQRETEISLSKKNIASERPQFQIPNSIEVKKKDETPTLAGIIQTALSVHLGAFLLFATLAFWILRLLVRVLLSNIHLENDSSERVVMAKTYLALIRDGALSKEDGMHTVLAALFRPSGDGIVKDEGIPPTTFDWFTKIGK